MPLHITIREKRKKHGLTQEQVAEYLGVSTPAVSKWESGTTCPDITLLAPLARLLDTDLNSLLCFKEDLSDQELGLFQKELADVFRQQGASEGFSFASEKIQEYPGCMKLINQTALLLEGLLFMSGITGEERDLYEKQIIALYERAAAGNDEDARNSACYMLSSKYMNKLDFKKAQELIDTLPDYSALDKRQMQALLYLQQKDYDKAAVILERKLLASLNELNSVLGLLADIALAEGREDATMRFSTLPGFLAKHFDLWEYNRFVIPLSVALEKKDIDSCVDALDHLLTAALTPWNPSKSPLYIHIRSTFPSEQIDASGNYGKRILPALIAELKHSDKYDFMREDSRFIHILKKYEDTYAKP